MKKAVMEKYKNVKRIGRERDSERRKRMECRKKGKQEKEKGKKIEIEKGVGSEKGDRR